jgi:hypothetical protein
VCVCLIYLGLIFVLLVKNEGGRVIIIVFLADFFYFVENLDSFWFCLGLGLKWKI